MLTKFLEHVKSFGIAKALMTAIELDLFLHLERSPVSRSELKQQLAIADGPIADAFLDVLIAFEILVEKNGKLMLLPLARSILPVYESIQSWNKEMQLFYGSLSNLTDLLRSGNYQDSLLFDYWSYKKSREPKTLKAFEVEDYSSIMDVSQIQLSKTILEHYDFQVHQHVIDVGGGYGRLAISLAQKYPHLTITIADLPAVCEGTQSSVNAAGLDERIQCLPVNFFVDDLPRAAADILLFVRVLHDWSDDEAALLIEKTRACLRRPGIVLIVEPMTEENSSPNPSSALSSLMVTLLGGRRRSAQEYIKLLCSAGYVGISWQDCGLSMYKMVTGSI